MGNRTVLILAIMSMFFSCKSSHNIENEDITTTANGNGEHIVGGYTAQRTPEEDEIILFKKATSSIKDSIFSVCSVATQVVAGLNYHFNCTYKAGQESGKCSVTVYRNLNGDLEITSITEGW